MRPTTRTISRAMPVLLAAAVVSVVLGILGMHALNTHGVMGTTDHAAMSMPATSITDQAPSPAAAVTTVVTAPVALGHDMGSMLMLCVSILVAAGIGLLALLLHRVPRSSWLLIRLRFITTVRSLIPARTGSGPPAVWAFSVIRC